MIKSEKIIRLFPRSLAAPLSSVGKDFMAKPSPKDKEKDKQKPSDEVVSPKDILGNFLKEKPESHLNFVVEKDYRASTGSMIWDVYTDGGLTPGLHRLMGPPESGKSSAALEIARNFLAMGPNGRGLYVKAEGKLPKEMIARTGLKFVWDYEEWEPGTIFVLESNHYEFIINLLRRLVIVPDNPFLYCVIFDSMDGLILENDVKKETGENNKVAGAPKLTKEFLQKMGNEFTKRGHMCLMLSQYSTNISLDPYAAPENKRPRQGGGGWAAAHYAHFVFDFGDTYGGDLIKENPKLPPSPTNKILGKRVKIKFKKSPNEKTGMEINYPVKYGVTGGSSVWTAVEVVDTMVMFGMIKIAAWIDFPSILASELKKHDIEAPAKFNGERKLINWLEADPKATGILKDYLRDTWLSSKQAAPENEAKEVTLQ